MKGGESSRTKMKRKRYGDISEGEEEERRGRRKKRMKRERYADISMEEEEEEERRRRRRSKKKMKRKRYGDISEEEEEERRRRRRRRKKMKMKTESKRKRKREEERRTSKMKRKRKYVVDIPTDVILVDILSRLPARCVWKLRSVCKDWKSQIESPSFADLQLRQSKLKKEERLFMFWNDRERRGEYSRTRFYSINKYGKAVKAVQEFLHPAEIKTSSMNGIVCYYGIDGEIKVCNPLTRQQINLSKPTFLLSSNRSKTSRLDIGIGYDSTSKTYKVLALYKKRHPQVEIFTLGGTKGCWRKLQLPSPTTNIYTHSDDGGCANGSAFWLTSEYHKFLCRSPDADMLSALMTFNFTQEKFEFVPLPPDYNSQGLLSIGEVGGRGCLVESSMKTQRVDLWTLAVNSGTQLWAHHHNVLPHCKDFISNTGIFPISSGLMQFDIFERAKHIFFYNRKGHLVKSKSFKVHGIPSRFCPLQLHTESLVSLTSISS